MLVINSSLSIPDDELYFKFISASGPGGQNVNKVASAVQLRFKVSNSPSLSETVKNRLVKLAGTKMTKGGTLIIEAKRYRAQERNQAEAESRLKGLIQKALINPKKRIPTLPTRASQVRRIDAKKRKGNIKNLRHTLND